MASLHQSKSEKLFQIKPSTPSIFNRKEIFPLSGNNSPSPTSLFMNYEYNKKNNIFSKNNNNNITSMSLKNNKSKYANFNIFTKREIAFHKCIENNKKVFKYQNFSLFEEKGKTITAKRIKKKKKRNIDNLIIKSFSALYLTQNILQSNKTILPFINKEKLQIREYEKKDLKKKTENKNKNKKMAETNYITNLKKNNFLNQLTMKSETERICKSKEEKKRNDIIYKKIDIYKRNNNKDLLKTRYRENMKEYLLEKYNNNVKEEKTKILQENITDKLQYINDKTQTLKSEFEIFNDRFIVKFGDYIKQLMKMKELEKNKDTLYMNYIFQLKKDIVSLGLKNKKIKNDRDGLNKWMYLQICVKEKKKVLPKYYKIILENKNEENKEELKKLTKSQLDNVLQYKNNIIYKNADLFLEQIKNFENKNVDLLMYYNLIREEIDSLNKEKEILNKNDQREENEKTDEEMVQIKMKMLFILKNKYTKLSQYFQSLKSLIDNYSDEEEDESTNKKHSKLYYKTSKILYNLNSYINYDFEKVGLIKTYKNISEESIIILNLTKIEILTDILIEKNISFKKNFSDKMNNFQTLLDKNKKLKKNIEQRKNIKIKLEKERDKIFRKYNKIIILPTHKININNVLTKKLILKKYREKKKNKEEIIDDYLYDLYEKEHNFKIK